MLWLAMVAGCRRGELRGVQWTDIDLANRAIWIAFSERRGKGGKSRRKDTKTHQKRRIAFDQEACEVLEDLLKRRKEACAALGIPFKLDRYLFSSRVDGAVAYTPSSVTRRYRRLAENLNISSHRLHSLRHYSASDLSCAGVDLRQGRSAHRRRPPRSRQRRRDDAQGLRRLDPPADKRAAKVIGKQLPRPGRQATESVATVVNGVLLASSSGNVASWNALVVDADAVKAICGSCQASAVGEEQVIVHELDVSIMIEEDLAPYQLVAAPCRTLIADDTFVAGSSFPTCKESAATHNVSAGTAHRAVALLVREGLVSASRGVRARVIDALPLVE